MTDRISELAAEALPCIHSHGWCATSHAMDCPAKYRPAVEAAMRRLAGELEDEVNRVFQPYVEWHVGAHEPDCSLDDTCDCKGKPINDAVNKFAREHGW